MATKLNRRTFLKATGVLSAGVLSGAATGAFSGIQPAYANNVTESKGASPNNRRMVQPLNINLSPEAEAARFLVQATLGADYDLIQAVKDQGIEAWLDEQFAIPASRLEPLVEGYQAYFTQYHEELDPWWYYFDWAWWERTLNSPDLLRQRVALALSEILVVSRRAELLEENAQGTANYYDLLLLHAFGNFRDLLRDVTFHPCMGVYLSHLSNRKADPSVNRYPDENYAREVMQLFTIGLFELNQDGTWKLDENGDPIPTYTNTDIAEFAKIFTGLTLTPDPVKVAADEAEWGYEFEVDEDYFLWPDWLGSMHVPMMMVEHEHELGEKRLLNGTVVPAGQSGVQDIEDAIDNLFYHPNVGPFIGRLLTQRLVKSNPSPAYISRVATAFNDNGQGVRGDMMAVVRTILLDEEARDLCYMDDESSGMLREPFVRYVSLLRTFNVMNRSGELIYKPWEINDHLFQNVLESPSVFNFFQPDHQPIGPIADAGLVAPEFQITNALTTVSAANYLYDMISWGAIYIETKESIRDAMLEELAGAKDARKMMGRKKEDWEEGTDIAYLNLDTEIALAQSDVDALIDRLDLLLTYGTLTAETREIIRNATSQVEYWPEGRVEMALSLFTMSPEYAILK